MVRDKSDIRQISDLKGKRMAWDYGGHAITQTWQNAPHGKRCQAQRREASAFLQLNDAMRAVPEGKVDATFAAIGIGINEEANAMEPIRFLSMPTRASNKILARYGASVVKARPDGRHPWRHPCDRLSASTGKLDQGQRENRFDPIESLVG